MPKYDYRCRTCDTRFEVQQSFAEDSLTQCPAAESAYSPPACVAPGSGEVRKVFSAPSITFKGDGFYKTDSRSGAGKSPAKTPADSSGKTDDGGSSSGDGSSGDSGSSSGDGKASDSSGDGKTSGSSGANKSERATAGAVAGSE